MLELGKFGAGSFVFSSQELPDLYVSAFSLREFKDNLSKLKDDPIELVRTIIFQFAHYSKNENDKISMEDVEKINEIELNEFSKIFISNNKGLLRDFSNTNSNKDESGNTKIEIGTKELQKKEGETYSEYLVRILLESKELTESFFASEAVKHLKQYKNLYNNEYMKQIIKRQLVLKNELNSGFETLKNYRPPISQTNETLVSIQTEMGALINFANKSFQLSNGLNDIVLAQLNESQKSNKQTTIINYFIIAIAVISLVATMIFSFLSYNSSIDSTKSLINQNERIIELLEQQIQIPNDTDKNHLNVELEEK